MAKKYKNLQNLTLGTMVVLGGCAAQITWAQSQSNVPPQSVTLQSHPAVAPVPPATLAPVTPLPATTMTVRPTSATTAPAPPASSYTYCNQGVSLSSQGQYAEAAQAFSSALAADPKMVSAYLGRALCYCQLGRNEEALNDCNAAIQLDPSSASAYGMRGTVYYRMQRFNEATADHSKAMELNGGKTSATPNDLLSQSCDQYVSKRYLQAIALASHAIEVEPNNDRAYDIRGMAHSENNDFSAAMSDFNQAIGMAPNNPDYRCHRGITEIKLGKLNDAMNDLTFAIERRSDFGIAYYDRGIVHILQGDYTDGLKDIQEAIRTDHRFALARYEFKQDTAKGKKHAQMSVPEEYYYRACTRILTTKNETAISDLHSYLSKTKWQGSLAPAAVVAIYLGEMRNHNTGSAQNVLKKGEQRCNKTVWPYPVIRYLHNDMPIADLLAQVNSQEQLSDVHAYVGLSEVFQNAKSATINPHLGWIQTNGSPSLVSYDMAIQQIEKETFTGPKGSQVPLP